MVTVPSIKTRCVERLPLIKGLEPPIHKIFDAFIRELHDSNPIKIFDEPLLFFPAPYPIAVFFRPREFWNRDAYPTATLLPPVVLSINTIYRDLCLEFAFFTESFSSFLAFDNRL